MYEVDMLKIIIIIVRYIHGYNAIHKSILFLFSTTFVLPTSSCYYLVALYYFGNCCCCFFIVFLLCSGSFTCCTIVFLAQVPLLKVSFIFP
jgi:hypothetical protein